MHPVIKILGRKKPDLRQRVRISFSGGKTSAYMTKMLLDRFRPENRELLVVFANTGQEHEETLKFVDRCDKAFGFNVVWLEAVVTHEARVGVGYKIVSFDTAARKGEPFEEVTKKYGIVNRMYKHCTGRLKTEPMAAFCRGIGWGRVGDYSTAIGIRADEMDRVSLSGLKNKGFFYPLVDMGITKEDIRLWWLKQSFNLNIPEHLSNCTWCWKKSNRKLLTLCNTHPEIFNFPARMEKLYAFAGGDRRDGQPRQERRFFRGNRTVADLFAEAAKPFVPFEDDKFIPFDDELDVGGACGDSCEIGADED